MAGEEVAAVLDPRLPLDHAHGQVPEEGQDAPAQADEQPQGEAAGQRGGGQHGPADQGGGHPASQGALPGLLGAEPGPELVPSQGDAHQVGQGVVAPGDEQSQEQPPEAVRRQAQRGDLGDEGAQVEGPGQGAQPVDQGLLRAVEGADEGGDDPQHQDGGQGQALGLPAGVDQEQQPGDAQPEAGRVAALGQEGVELPARPDGEQGHQGHPPEPAQPDGDENQRQSDQSCEDPLFHRMLTRFRWNGWLVAAGCTRRARGAGRIGLDPVARGRRPGGGGRAGARRAWRPGLGRSGVLGPRTRPGPCRARPCRNRASRWGWCSTRNRPPARSGNCSGDIPRRCG